MSESTGVTQEQAVFTIRRKQEEDFDRADHAERMLVGRRKGVLIGDPSFVYTLDELKALVPLKRDAFHYLKYALTKHGLLSVGKARGRRKPRMNGVQQAIKSAALTIFQDLFTTKAATVKATCDAEGITYLGIPEETIQSLGALAFAKASVAVKERRRAKSAKARRRQQAHRAVNAGTLPANTNINRLVNKGGAYGR